MKLVLASKSPRRKEILSMVTSNFSVRVSGADESVDSVKDLYEIPKILAERKAEAVSLNDDEIIIGCDTVVIYENELLGKPNDKADAIRMLKLLSGTTHYVVSGLALKSKKKSYSTSVTTAVIMRELTDSEIVSYVEKYCPTDKAGAYGIQEMAGSFVEKIDGDFYNVVGLPLCELVLALRHEFGIELN
ncbi:MAG: septum formation protein Maf [Clostridia bacterium]|nr:septum formation protein Maf [Clostridia bacterium]